MFAGASPDPASVLACPEPPSSSITVETPPAITAKLEKALSQSIRDPEVSAKLKNLAVAPGGGPPDDFRRIVEDDIVKVRDVVKAANLTFEE